MFRGTVLLAESWNLPDFHKAEMEGEKGEINRIINKRGDYISCIYRDAADAFFKKVSTYNIKTPSNIERKVSDMAGAISDKFRHGNSVENHLMAYLALGAAAVAVNEAGVPLNQSMAFYAPAVADAIVHANDFVVPHIKTAIKNVLTENPYAGNGVPPASP